MLKLREDRLSLVLAAVLVAHAVWTSDCWPVVARAWWFATDAASYRQHRRQAAFRDFPIDDLRQALDAYLPGRRHVALSDALVHDEFMKQRLTEGLYPRVIDARAPFTLEIVPGSRFDPETGVRLVDIDGGRLVVLRGVRTHLAASTSVAEPFSFDLLRLIASALSVLGFGLLVARLGPSLWRRRELLIPFAFLAGAIVVALTCSIATWLQLPLMGPVFGAVGLALAFVLPASLVRRRLITRGPIKVPAPEAWVVAALLLVTFAAMAVTPLTEWDARSTWFFRANQIHAHHCLALDDAVRADSQWSHFTYPLLLPAWLAQFTTFSSVYNERMAAMGGPTLMAVLLALIGIFARARIGRWPAALFTLALLVTAFKLVVVGYADSLLMLMLTLAFLALGSPDGEGIGWLALLAASLTKEEGLILGIIVAAPFLIRGLRRVAVAAAVFMPAAIHFAWGKALHLAGDFDHIRWREVFGALTWRLKVIESAMWAAATGWSPLFLEGIVAIAVTVLLAVELRRRDRMAFTSVGMAAACTAFIVGAFAVTPKDLSWHLGTAVHRLMLHPAVFAVLAPFLLLGEAAAPGISAKEKGRRNAAAVSPA